MKRGTPDHPKLKALMVALNIDKYAAVGVLETLWHFTARYAADGDIGIFTDEEIAAAIGWKKRSGKAKVSSGSFLVQALVSTRWLDGPYEVTPRSPRGHAKVSNRSLLVHDWKDHADQSLKRFLASRNLAFASLPLPVACSLKPIANSLKPLPDNVADDEFFNRDFAAESSESSPPPQQAAPSIDEHEAYLAMEDRRWGCKIDRENWRSHLQQLEAEAARKDRAAYEQAKKPA